MSQWWLIYLKWDELRNLIFQRVLISCPSYDSRCKMWDTVCIQANERQSQKMTFDVSMNDSYYTMFWMNDRNSIYLKKLNRCTRSRLTGSSSIVRIHSDFTVRDSYMTRWVEHGCAWVIHIWQSMSNRYTMHMQLIFTMYGSIWDLQKLWCISYVEYVLYANHQSDFYLREESLRLVDMKHWKCYSVWYHLVFFFFLAWFNDISQECEVDSTTWI